MVAFTYSYTGSDRNGDGSDSFDYEISDATDTVTATVSIKLSKGGKPNSTSGPASAGLERALQVRADHEDELFRYSPACWAAASAPTRRATRSSGSMSSVRPRRSTIRSRLTSRGCRSRVVVTGPDHRILGTAERAPTKTPRRLCGVFSFWRRRTPTRLGCARHGRPK